MRTPFSGAQAVLALVILDRDRAGGAAQYGRLAPPIFIASSWGLLQQLGTSEWILRLVPTVAAHPLGVREPVLIRCQLDIGFPVGLQSAVSA